MKFFLLAILLLALPAFGENSKEQSIREFYEAWLPTHQAELDQAINTIVCDPKCHVGGAYKNPERTDPMYLSWKTLRRQQYVADTFERHWDPDKFKGKHVDSSDFRQWIRENLEVKSVGFYHVANLQDGPAPEEWIPDRVSPATGQSVDKRGDVTMESATSSRSTGVVYFWIPLVIGMFIAVFLMPKSPSFGFCAGYFGYGFLIGGTTGLKIVALELMSAYVIVGIIIVGIVRLALSGFGLSKDTKGN